MKARQQANPPFKRILQGRIRKDIALFLFFYFFFFAGSLGWFRHFHLLSGWVGGWGVGELVVLPRWLPLQGYYRMILVVNWEMSKLDGTNHHYYFLYNKSKYYIQII